MDDTGIGNASVCNLVCPSSATLHLRLNLLTACGKDKIVRALQDGVPPETAISRKAKLYRALGLRILNSKKGKY